MTSTTSRCSYTTTAVVFAAAVLLVAVGNAAEIGSDEDRLSRFTALRELGVIKGVVETVEVAADDVTFANRVAADKVPKLVKGSIVNSWKAMKKWKPSYLKASIKAEKQPTLADVQTYKTPVFRFWHDEHPMCPLEGIADVFRERTFTRRNDLTVDEYFDSISSTEGTAADGTYNYYAVRLHKYGRAARDANPLEPLIVKGEDYDPSLSDDFRTTICWTGGVNTTTHAHYDLLNNFYTQVYGHKHILLFPPTEAEKLYIYPHLHPGHQQSQVDFDAPDLEKFPDFANAAALEVILGPGDVLHVPPLWFHHLVSLDLSASVSVWSPCPHLELSNEATSLPLPYLGGWHRAKTLLAGRVHLKKMVAAVVGGGEEEALEYLQRLYESRYAPLKGEVPALWSASTGFCKSDLELISEDDYEAHWMADVMDDEYDEVDVSHTEDTIFQSLNDVETHATVVSQILNEIDGEGARDVWLGNLVEMIALTVVRGTDGLGQYLHDLAYC